MNVRLAISLQISGANSSRPLECKANGWTSQDIASLCPRDSFGNPLVTGRSQHMIGC